MSLLRKLFCDHKKHINTVFIEDRIYDYKNDNSDLDDIFRTFIEIVYCENCGKIISMRHTSITDNYISAYGFGMFYKISSESSQDEILKFENATGLKANEITLYKYGS